MCITPKSISRSSITIPRQRAPKGRRASREVDPELLETYAKLGIPLKEQAVLAGVQGAPRVAVDAVFDSVSVVTTFKEELAKAGVIFCSISEAVQNHPELVRKYLGSVVPDHRQFLCHAQLRGLSPTAASSMCRKACAARWSSPPISASTRSRPGSSSAR